MLHHLVDGEERFEDFGIQGNLPCFAIFVTIVFESERDFFMDIVIVKFVFAQSDTADISSEIFFDNFRIGGRWCGMNIPGFLL